MHEEAPAGAYFPAGQGSASLLMFERKNPKTAVEPADDDATEVAVGLELCLLILSAENVKRGVPVHKEPDGYAVIVADVDVALETAIPAYKKVVPVVPLMEREVSLHDSTLRSIEEE